MKAESYGLTISGTHKIYRVQVKLMTDLRVGGESGQNVEQLNAVMP